MKQKLLACTLSTEWKDCFALGVFIAGLQHDISCPGATMIGLAVIMKHLAEQRVLLGKRDDA